MTLTKDGNPLYGDYNIESKEKITPPQSLTAKEEEINKGNEWLDSLRGKRVGTPAIKVKRLSNTIVSRGQRHSVVGERHGAQGNILNSGQRKAISGI